MQFAQEQLTNRQLGPHTYPQNMPALRHRCPIKAAMSRNASQSPQIASICSQDGEAALGDVRASTAQKSDLPTIRRPGADWEILAQRGHALQISSVEIDRPQVINFSIRISYRWREDFADESQSVGQCRLGRHVIV